MTDCIAQVAFSFQQNLRIVGDFSGVHLTSDAGLLPVCELDHRLGRTATSARLLTDSADAATVTHGTRLLLFGQLLFAPIADYRDTTTTPAFAPSPPLDTFAPGTPRAGQYPS